MSVQGKDGRGAARQLIGNEDIKRHDDAGFGVNLNTLAHIAIALHALSNTRIERRGQQAAYPLQLANVRAQRLLPEAPILQVSGLEMQGASGDTEAIAKILFGLKKLTFC